MVKTLRNKKEMYKQPKKEVNNTLKRVGKRKVAKAARKAFGY